MRGSHRIVVGLGAFGMLAAGCLDRDLETVDPIGQTESSTTVVQSPSGKVDLLVVMDNSGSMQQEQDALAAQLPRLVRGLMEPEDPTQNPVTDLHVGVVSTDLGTSGYEVSTCGGGLFGYDRGDDGCLLHEPAPSAGCAGTYPRFLEREADAAGYSAEQLGADFACIASLGTQGCGFEQQLKAARRALVDQTRTGGCNEGFLRDDAILAVLVVTDEEDCSYADPRIADRDAVDLGCLNLRCALHPELLEPVARLVEELQALRPQAGRFVLAEIVGVPVDEACEGRGDEIGGCLLREEMQYRPEPDGGCEILPACQHPLGWGYAFPGRRLVEAAQKVGHHALVRSICNEDWTPAVDGILELIRGAVQDVCFPRELALDPATCRSECLVVEVQPDDRPCPAGRIEATPALERDEAGEAHRRCVVPQAERAPRPGGGCEAPSTEGWYYLPAADSTAGCNQVKFTAGAVPAPDTATELECLSYVCPAERRCGPASAPGASCCEADEICVTSDPLAGGACVPAG